jgi:transcriptional regulator GlxA family with amidase domain
LKEKSFMKIIGLLLVLLPCLACAQARNEKFYCTPCNSHCDTISHTGPGVCDHCNMKLVARNDADIQVLKTSFKKRLNVAIFIYQGVELLDFAGPGEVFASTPGFNVYTVAAKAEPITSQGFVKITPQYGIDRCPKPDIIVLPGGASDIPMKDEKVIAWVRQTAPGTIVTLSVCTGASLLSKAGLLDGKTATTFHNYIETLQQMTPRAKVIRDTRFVDNGSIITTAGVSAGIDGALHVIEKLRGREAAQTTATYMEYDKWKPEEGLVVKY